jgi:hypothetical protein
MIELKLSTKSIAFVIGELTKLITSGKDYRVNIVEWREKRSLSQNSLYWKWLAEIDKQNPLVVVNSKDCGAELWHEVFKKFYCPGRVISNGNTEMEVVSTKLLDVGEMNHYLTQIELWAMNRGFKLTIPVDSEYMKLLDEQNGRI